MSSIISKLINLAGNITGTLPVANGGTGVTTSTGTTNVVLSNGPTLSAPVLGTPASGTLTNCTGYPTFVYGTTSGIVASTGLTGKTAGTTVAAGVIGETLTAAPGGNVAVGTTTTPVNITSVSVTAGVWEATATVQFNAGTVLTAPTLLAAGISLNTATFDSSTLGGFYQTTSVTVAANGNTYFPVGSRFFNFSGTTTVNLVGRVDYTTATGTNWGSPALLQLRRIG